MSENPVKATIEALYKPIEGIVKTLAGPAAEEIGLTFRDSVQAWRFKRQVRLFERVKKICHHAGIKPQAVKLQFLFDVVDNGSLEPDDELQDRWANLLSNAADPNYDGLISTAFPDILRQISKDEAFFLEDLHKREQIRFRKDGIGVKVRVRTPPIEIQEVYEDNLRRLGVIERIDYDKEPPLAAYSSSLSGLGEPRKWKLTAFGIAFIDACSSPKKSKKTK